MENVKIGSNNVQVTPSQTSGLSDEYDPDLKLSYSSIANQDLNGMSETFICSFICATKTTCA